MLAPGLWMSLCRLKLVAGCLVALLGSKSQGSPPSPIPCFSAVHLTSTIPQLSSAPSPAVSEVCSLGLL